MSSMSLLPRQVLNTRLAAARLASPTRSYNSSALRRTSSLFYNVTFRQPDASSLSILHRSSADLYNFSRQPLPLSSSPRQFSTSRLLRQQAQRQPEEDVAGSSRESAEAKAESSASEGKESSEQKAKDGAKDEGTGKEEDSGKKEEQKKEEPPPPPHGDKSPWQVFTETLQTEFKASKEWNESTKALGSSVNQFTESESVKRARQLYEQTSGVASDRVSSAVKTTGRAIGSGAAWTWDTSVMKGVRKGANTMGRGVDKATKPIRETQAFKNVKDVIDDGSSSRYGGWVEKEERRKARELRELKAARTGRRVEKMEEDPEAGTNVTLHKDSAWHQTWQNFKEQNRMVQSLFTLKEAYNESENPFVSTARSISDRVAGFFAENETAMVIRKFREIDPNFQLEPFLREMREYILPEVLDAYVKGDIETLREWLSAAQFQVYQALSEQWTKAGLRVDGRILDIRNVDILSAKLLDPGEVPVFIITCRTQEVHVYRKIKTGELAAGMEDKVQLVTYAVGVTRTPEDVNNPETRGWRLIELQKSSRDWV